MTHPIDIHVGAQDRAAAENRHDGPMPPEVIARLKHGSATAAEIARTEDSMHYFRREHSRMTRSAGKWLFQGNREMHDSNREDAALYFREWRQLRWQLNGLRAEVKAQAQARADRAQLLNAKRVMDQINQVTDDRTD